jgi:anti-sigma regulatory factor (Ser/Thr protein kinase)
VDDAVQPPAALRLRRLATAAELRAIRRRVAAWARSHRLPDDVLDDLQLALGEAVANGVEHAYGTGPPGYVDVELVIRPAAGDARAVAVQVADHGRWRPAPAVAGHRGRGLNMIERLAEHVDVAGTGAGTRVSFEIPVPA